jgi:hypothetical protein
LVLPNHNKERNSPMTEGSVDLSISVKAFDESIEFHREVPVTDLEEGLSRTLKEIGCQVLATGIAGLDGELRRMVPEQWRNVGTEERRILSSLGWVSYRRRIYQDEEGRRRKPVDEMLGIERYARDSERVREMAAWLACEGTYRKAARQLSWLIQDKVSPSSIQRMVWQVGNRIADGEEAERIRMFEQGEEVKKGQVRARVLYGESDGVWLHLQREKRRSAEVRVVTMYSGKKRIGMGRNGLENKSCYAAIGVKGEAWQEHVVRVAHRSYDLEQTELMITGGDGNQWVRSSFNRMGIHQEFVLDRFHLSRAARGAFRDKKKARAVVRQLRHEGYAATSEKLRRHIDEAEADRKEKLIEFHNYVYNHQDGMLDLQYRNPTYDRATLGAIEGNLDKLVVQRMKGRGRSWRLRGARAMLALCQHKATLKELAFPYLPLNGRKPAGRGKKLKPDQGDWVVARMPIFHGPDQDKPWVREFRRMVHRL